jgi:uncharacterized protein
MDAEFDSNKDVLNQERHGLSLAFGSVLFQDDNHLVMSSIRQQDNEIRFKVVAKVNGKFFTGVFTWRDNARRFISVRRSNKREERAYSISS